ncbi:MAG: Flp pilus assembly protein TadB [Caulobacteraceae bacterium]|nr:Flp pilus assembly protein TadB [Caulobacteraceae bacterium]
MDPMAFGLLGLALLVGVVGLFFGLADPGRRRMSQRARRLVAGPTGRRAPRGGPSLVRQRRGGLDDLVNRLTPRPDALRARLAATGLHISIGRYGLICAGLAGGIPLVLMLKGMSPPGAILLGALAGLGVPHMAVGWLAKRRRGKFAKLFPEAIGLLVRGLKAGLPVTETIGVAGREISDPVGAEFRRVSHEVRLGQSLEDAMWATAKRLNLAEFNFLVITLSVQRETGGNLAETLENLDDILRKRQAMKLKVKAMSSEAVASAGIIGCLPFVMSGILFLVSRDYIMTLFKSPLGLVLLAGAVTSMVMGIGVMMKMVSFDI